MRIRRGKHHQDDKNEPVSQETQAVLNSAIVNIVQAIGSKAGVLVFWDELRQTPGQVSSYGLSEAFLEQISPLIVDLVQQLRERTIEAGPGERLGRPDETVALQTDVHTDLGLLHLICLPIQTAGRFIAGLCLFQSASGGLSVLDDPSSLLPLAAGVRSGVIPDQPGIEEASFDPEQSGLVLDRSDLVARNAWLLKRLVEENQRLAAIIEYSADGILIIDNQCNIVGFNPAFARLSGYAVEELRGRNCYEALKFAATRGDAHCGKLCPIKLGTFVNKAEDERRSEVVLTTKTGERRDVELTYSVIVSDEQRILGGILGARDITARKEAEELQSTFLSVISHELQTPIAIIKGYAGLYADKTTPIDPARVREKMQIIEEESERLSKLVDNLLYASRLQAGGIELNRQPFDIARMMERVVQKMRDVSKSHKIEVAPPEQPLPAVSGDYDKIEQVLVNLVENAIKYSPAGGPIVLAGRATSDEVVVSVTDSGIGVPEAERQRIFERFSRLDSRYVRERKGAGLGLYICKAIVEAHGGRIWVEAAPVEQGRGSRFNFTLPRDEPAHLPVLFGKI